MRVIARVCALLAVSIFLGEAGASAQGYIAPSIGATFSNPSAQGRANFGVDFGWVSREAPIGIDLDIMYAPSFFGNIGPYGENSVTTGMINISLAPGAPGGGRYGRHGYGGGSSVRPYVSFGAGLMHEVVTPVDVPGNHNTDLGVNAAIGVMAFTRRSVGVRGELRYFRDLIDNQVDNHTNIDFGAFHFWRGSIGLVFSF
jgi:hypothetical protein